MKKQKKSKTRSFLGKDSQSSLQSVIQSLANTKPAFRSKNAWQDKFAKVGKRLERYNGKSKESLQNEYMKLLENKI